MEEQRKIAFDFARDTTKQLITLATTIIAFTVTFAGNIVPELDSFGRILISLSWLWFLVSVVAGVWTLLALTGTLEPEREHQSEDVKSVSDSGKAKQAIPSIRHTNVTLPSIFQIFTFLLGLGFTVWFGIRSMCAG